MNPEQKQAAAEAANLDIAVGFTLPHRSARGRIVRLGPLLDQVLSAHDYPAPIARILSEALTLTALLGATLKDAGGQLTMQAQTESGVIDLMVCDYRGGELRGYVRFDPDRLAEIPVVPTLEALFGRAISPSPSIRPCRASATRASFPLKDRAWRTLRRISSLNPNRFPASSAWR